MKRLFEIGMLLILASVFSTAGVLADPPAVETDWILTFEDTFDGPTIDESKWFPAYRTGRKEYYNLIKHPSRWADLQANYLLEDGLLKLRLDEEKPKRTNRTERCVSSMQTSIYRYNSENQDFSIEKKFTQKYGWFEIRCRMPSGTGLHSAFWLTQAGAHDQEYSVEGLRKNCGTVEIDIFEQVGKNMFANEFNVHFTPNGHYSCKTDFDCSKEFHVWALEWNEGELKWYLDGKHVHTWNGKTPPKEMFILIGLYQGVFDPTDPNMPYPRDFEIDYIRVWQRR